MLSETKKICFFMGGLHFLACWTSYQYYAKNNTKSDPKSLKKWSGALRKTCSNNTRKICKKTMEKIRKMTYKQISFLWFFEVWVQRWPGMVLRTLPGTFQGQKGWPGMVPGRFPGAFQRQIWSTKYHNGGRGLAQMGWLCQLGRRFVFVLLFCSFVVFVVLLSWLLCGCGVVLVGVLLF